MALDYATIKNWAFDEVRQQYDDKDVMLYALSIGLGHDPTDARQLPYVYEDGLKVFPTIACVLGYPGFWMKNPETGIDWVKVLHGEQRVTFHKPFPAQGTAIGRTRVSHVIDKGAKTGAIVISERTVTDQASGDLLATVEQTTFCRGDGGFGQGDDGPEALPAVPDRPYDLEHTLSTLPQAALIYRLNADRNPLHADPEVAAKAGYERPILHGLCTYGVAAHAIVASCADYDTDRLEFLGARFSAPVIPGETLSVEMWREGAGNVHFQARVKERDVVVLRNGLARLKA